MDPRTGGWSLRARLVNHSLLIETGAGLVLVDTGLGLRDVADTRGRLGPWLAQRAAGKSTT